MIQAPDSFIISQLRLKPTQVEHLTKALHFYELLSKIRLASKTYKGQTL
jgi:hypothetical protein